MIDNYQDLPLGVYLDILAVPKDGDNLDYQVAVVALLSGMTEDDVLDLPLDKYQRLVDATAFLASPPPEYDGRRIADSFTIEGTRLRLTKDPGRICVAQYVDYQNYLKDGGVQRTPELLSCILIPEGKTYGDGYDVADIQRLIRRMPVTDALAIAAFFLRRFADFTAATLTSSKLRLKLKPKRKRTEAENRLLKTIAETEDLLKGGDGSPMSTRLLNLLAGRGTRSGR